LAESLDSKSGSMFKFHAGEARPAWTTKAYSELGFEISGTGAGIRNLPFISGGEFGERVEPVKDAIGRSDERPSQATGYGTSWAGAGIQASPVYRTC